MRIRLILLLALIALPAQAQVSVNKGALDTLAPAKPALVPPPAPAPVAKPMPNSPVIAPKPVAPTAPQVGAAPPPGVVIPSPIVVPTRPASPVPPAPVAADAPTTFQKLKSGLRVVFGSGRSDLNPATETAIKALVQPLASGSEGPSYTITCFAAGTPEDPSTPRRLSLSRALAVRSVLISQGVVSVRIYVRAFGPASPGFADGPPDRADIVLGPNPVAPTPPAPAKS